MKILSGIASGAVLQREENNLCRVQFEAEASGEVKSSIGCVKNIGEGVFELSGIPVGGPYDIELSDNKESVLLAEIYVGDVWLLGGQSNMDGSAEALYEDFEYAKNPSPKVRAFYMDEEWRPAKFDMHNKLIAKEKPYIDSVDRWLDGIAKGGMRLYDSPPYGIKCCVGPGVSFAREMYRLTGGVPQGVIPAAVGGAPIEMWIPSEDGSENYYDAALHRIKLSGNNIKGVFWAQGEGEPRADLYPGRIEIIRDAIFNQTGIRKVPFVVMQSFVNTMDFEDESHFRWSRFREMQRKMSLEMENITTIATNDCALEDGIHLNSPSQEKMGIRGARAMLYMTDGIGFAQPELDKIIVEEDKLKPDNFSLLRIRYRNISGALRSEGNPTGFEISNVNNPEELPGKFRLCKMTLHQNEVHLRVERPRKELKDFALWYGFGHYSYCNIADGEGRALPAMGPINLKDYM